MPTITMCYFAGLREQIGCNQEQYELPAQSSDQDILQAVIEKHPAAADRCSRSRVAVNHEFIRGKVQLEENVEIALIPPVSGG